MTNWRITACILFLFCFSSSIHIQAQSDFSAKQMWQYGVGVIYDFDWQDTNLTFPAGGYIWTVDPVSNPLPREQESNSFPLSKNSAGTRIATLSQDEIIIKDTSTEAIISRIPHSYVERGDLAWQPNANLLAMRGYDQRLPEDRRYYIELWDADTAQLVGTIGGYTDNIITFSWQSEGKFLAVSLNNNTVIIEDVTNNTQHHRIDTQLDVSSLAWSLDGQFLAFSSNGASPVHVWRTDTFEPIAAKNIPVFILSIAWNAQSTLLAGALPEGGVGLWNIETSELISLGAETEDGVDHLIEHVAWYGNMLATLDRSHRLRVWNTDEKVMIWDSSKYQFGNLILTFATHPSAPFIAIGYNNTLEIPLLDAETGTLQQSLKSSKLMDLSSNMAWDLSGERLAVTLQDLFIWPVMPEVGATPIRVDDVDDLSWSPDGRLAVTSDYQQILRVIDGKTGELLESPDISHVLFPRWSPDGRFVALYRNNPPGDDRTIPPYQIDIWDLQQDLVKTVVFQSKDDEVLGPSQSFAWMPNSSELIGYTTSGALWHWSVNAQQVDVLAADWQANTVSLSPVISINQNGDLLAVHNPKIPGNIDILAARSGSLLLTLSDFPTEPRSFAWRGDSMLLVAYDGVLRAYQIY